VSKKGVDLVVFSGLGKIGSGSFILIYHRKSHQAIIIDCGIDVSYLIQDLETVKDPADGCWIHVFDWIKITEERDGPIEILGIFITHIHLDHIGGIPFLLKEICYDRGRPPIPIFCSAFSRRFLISYLSDKLGDGTEGAERSLDIKIEAIEGHLRLDPFQIIPFPAPHSTPGNLAYGVVVANQRFFFSSDFKLRLNGDADRIAYLKSISSFKPDFLVLDGTGALRPGYTGLESDVEASLNEIIINYAGLLYFTFFSTNLWRLLGIHRFCKEHGIPWTFLGASVKSILLASGDPELVTIALTGTVPGAKVVVAAGCLGNPGSAAERLSRGETVNGYRIEPNDKVVGSTSQIPNCRRQQLNMIRDFSALRAPVFLDSTYPDDLFLRPGYWTDYKKNLHVSGHGGQSDLRDTIDTLKSRRVKYHRQWQWRSPQILAYHADPVSMAALKALAVNDCGIPSENVHCPVPADGEIVTFSF
jgi:ribonuclease J